MSDNPRFGPGNRIAYALADGTHVENVVVFVNRATDGALEYFVIRLGADDPLFGTALVLLCREVDAKALLLESAWPLPPKALYRTKLISDRDAALAEYRIECRRRERRQANQPPGE